MYRGAWKLLFLPDDPLPHLVYVGLRIQEGMSNYKLRSTPVWCFVVVYATASSVISRGTLFSKLAAGFQSRRFAFPDLFLLIRKKAFSLKTVGSVLVCGSLPETLIAIRKPATELESSFWMAELFSVRVT